MMSQRKIVVSAFLGVAILGTGLALWSSPKKQSTQPQTTAQTLSSPASSYIPRNNSIPAIQSTVNADYRNEEFLQSSLLDTDAPDSLRLDNGILVVDEGYRDLIDYFFSLHGEMDPDEIFALLERYLTQVAPNTDIASVMAVAEQYLDFLQSPSNHEIDKSLSLLEQLEELKRIRREALGVDIAEQFYSDEENYMLYSIQKMQLIQNAELSEIERNQQLAQLNSTLSAELTQGQEQERTISTLRSSVADLRQQGASDEEIRQYRVSLVGEESAERLGELDNSRNEWNNRYSDYRQEAETLLASNLSKEDQQQELARVRERYFDTTEVLRVAALDRISQY